MKVGYAKSHKCITYRWNKEKEQEPGNELENRSCNYETKCLRNWKIKKIIKEKLSIKF